MSKNLISIFCLFLLPCPGICRQLQADSIYRIMTKKTYDSTGIKELVVYTNKLASHNPQEAVKTARYVIDASRKINFIKGVAAGYNELGHAFERHSVNDSAFYHFFISGQIFTFLKDPLGRAEVFYNIGNLHEIMGRFDSSAYYLYKSLQIADSINDTDLKGKNDRILGNIMAKQNRLDEALAYYDRSLNLLKLTGNFPELIARVQENIALVYTTKKEFTKAETFFKDAVAIYKQIDETRGLARANLNIANLRVAQGRYEEALDNSFFALAFYKNINHLNGEAESLMQISDAYLKKKEYKKAIDYANQTIDIVQKNADRDIELTALRVLQRSYFETGEHRVAYDYLVKANSLGDSIFSDKKESIITELQTKYETEKKEHEIELLNKDKELSQARSRKQQIFRNAVIAGSVMLLIIILLVFNRYRSYQKSNRQKQLARISNDLHDEVGSTLSSIGMYSSFAGEQLAENKTGEVITILDEISASAREMGEDMNDIIWAINPRHDNFKSIVIRLKNFATIVTQSKQIELHFEADESLYHISPPADLRKNIYLIAKEAINNSVKYSGCKNLVIKLQKDKKRLLAEIRDDGQGFDIAGIHEGNGLRNMQQRADQIHAELAIESAPGKGTRVCVIKKL